MDDKVVRLEVRDDRVVNFCLSTTLLMRSSFFLINTRRKSQSTLVSEVT